MVELLVVTGIITILVVLAVPKTGSLIDRAQGVLCTSKLRNLWLRFHAELIDGTGWPQLPKEMQVGSLEEQKWWLDYSVKNLEMKPGDWICPSIQRRIDAFKGKGPVPIITYMPTLFDPDPATPTKWPRMPWFTEMGAMHGKPNLSVRADGTVCPVRDP
jgi:hypothetical protein